MIYHIKCNDCHHNYIGETGRQLDTRIKEHVTRSSSAIYEHIKNTGHTITPKNTKIIDRESNFTKRKIKESIAIHLHRPTLNRDGGLEIPGAYYALLRSHDPRGHMTKHFADEG